MRSTPTADIGMMVRVVSSADSRPVELILALADREVYPHESPGPRVPRWGTRKACQSSSAPIWKPLPVPKVSAYGVLPLNSSSMRGT